jgi:hypothetical protein
VVVMVVFGGSSNNKSDSVTHGSTVSCDPRARDVSGSHGRRAGWENVSCAIWTSVTENSESLAK